MIKEVNSSTANQETEPKREPIYVERDGHLATVTINNPAKLNAMTSKMWRLLRETIDTLSADDSLRCIILRGAGEEAFCPGCDINEFSTVRSNKEQGVAYGKLMREAINALYQCRHPLVAQIHGLCVGAGLELASLCDVRICGDASTFGAPIKNIGLVMAYYEIEPLVRLVGKATTLEILLEGRIFDAEEALRKGLVSRVMPDDLVQEETLHTANRIIIGAPLVARWHKKFMRRLADPTLLTESEYDECFDCFNTEDFRNGCAAFLLHNRPNFQGK